MKNRKIERVKKDANMLVFLITEKDSNLFGFPTEGQRSRFISDFMECCGKEKGSYYVTADAKVGDDIDKIKWDMPEQFSEDICPCCREEAQKRNG